MPGLERWLRRVFTVMGGFIMGVGVLTIFVAVSPDAARERWTGGVLAVAGLLTVGTMSVTNFQLDSDFKWLRGKYSSTAETISQHAGRNSTQCAQQDGNGDHQALRFG